MAQLAEQAPCKRQVVSSNLTVGSNGDVSERFMVTVLKTVDANSVRGFKSYHLRHMGMTSERARKWYRR